MLRSDKHPEAKKKPESDPADVSTHAGANSASSHSATKHPPEELPVLVNAAVVFHLLGSKFSKPIAEKDVAKVNFKGIVSI